MNLSNAYSLSQDLTESTQKLQAHQNDLKGIKTSQHVFTLATYFIYFSFTSVIFAGVTVWKLQDYIFSNYTNVIGMVWALVTVFAVPLALSLAKHFNYKAIAKNSVERGHRGQVVIHAIIALALISGLYYEAISSSSNLQAKAFHSVENSKAGDAILKTTVTSSSSGAIAGLIADAEYKLVGCQRRLKEGSVKDCNNSQAKVDSLKAQANAERDSVATANVAAIGAKQDALERERDNHALPAAKYAAEITNMSKDSGTMIIVIIAALFFELIHITTIFNEARALRGIDAYSSSLKGLNGEYFKATGKTFDSCDFKDNRTIDLSDKPLNVPVDDNGADFEVTTKGQPYKDNKTGFGFIPQTAKLFKWQNSEIELPAKPEKPGFGFIPTRSRESPDAENRARYPQEILYPTGTGKTADDYALIPRKDFKRTGDGQETTSKPLQETTLKPLAKGSEVVGEKPLAKGFDGAESLYGEWVASVRAGECKPSVEPTWHWVQKRISPTETGSKTNDRTRISIMQKAFFNRAIREGLMQINPTYSNGGKKYNWIG